MQQIKVEELRDCIGTLRAGDRIYLTGTVYTARDAAHKRIMALMEEGKPLPFPLEDAVIFYSGATPAPEGRAIGSCGPTTSCRMDPFTPLLYDKGVCATIGKGERSQEVTDAIVRNKAVYLCALGGAGALAAQRVTACDVIAFEDLGCEAVKRLCFREFPLTVGIDCQGNTVFQQTKE
ncbi:MAG: fumarate hydratase C-terminal domain-containing protein [Clostridia bacterium]|nr:fumarate hydratase C-terminal domain-containing protein [Clostridia bacterium]